MNGSICFFIGHSIYTSFAWRMLSLTFSIFVFFFFNVFLLYFQQIKYKNFRGIAFNEIHINILNCRFKFRKEKCERFRSGPYHSRNQENPLLHNLVLLMRLSTLFPMQTHICLSFLEYGLFTRIVPDIISSMDSSGNFWSFLLDLHVCNWIYLLSKIEFYCLYSFPN